MKVINCAFKLPSNNKAPVGYQKIDCHHMVFDIKMTLKCKARDVTGGHQTEPSKDVTFASVVSRDGMCIAFLVVVLNNLEILSADINGAYLNAPCTDCEKAYIIASKEFRANKQGHTVVIKHALYGLCSSGKA